MELVLRTQHLTSPVLVNSQGDQYGHVHDPRKTQLYRSRKPEGDAVLVAAMDELRKRHKRSGYRGVWSRLRPAGWRVNRKRVHRIWKAEGWQIRTRKRKRRGKGSSENNWDEPERILALDDALQRLGVHDPRAAEVIQLRYFAGMTVAETAETLEISERTVKREWAFARAWLRKALS